MLVYVLLFFTFFLCLFVSLGVKNRNVRTLHTLPSFLCQFSLIYAHCAHSGYFPVFQIHEIFFDHIILRKEVHIHSFIYILLYYHCSCGGSYKEDILFQITNLSVDWQCTFKMHVSFLLLIRVGFQSFSWAETV